MAWHRFNQDETQEVDYEGFRWTHVMPGDIVQSRGTCAWKPEDLSHRHNEKTALYKLHSAPVLVIARIPGIPGEDFKPDTMATFVCLTRHGIVCVIGDLKFGRD